MNFVSHARISVFLLGLIASTSVLAADAPAAPPGPLAQACKQDVETLCPGIQPGERRIAQCMSRHRSKVSEGCKAALKEARAKQKAAKAAKPAASG